MMEGKIMILKKIKKNDLMSIERTKLNETYTNLPNRMIEIDENPVKKSY